MPRIVVHKRLRKDTVYADAARYRVRGSVVYWTRVPVKGRGYTWSRERRFLVAYSFVFDPALEVLDFELAVPIGKTIPLDE